MEKLDIIAQRVMDEPSGQLPLNNANLDGGDGVKNVGVVTNNIVGNVACYFGWQ